MWEWIKENQILSGTGATAVTLLSGLLVYLFTKQSKSTPPEVISAPKKSKAEYKILFVDDNHFRVPDILKKSGWTNTKRVRDIASMDDPEVSTSDLFFVDIQGVGRALQFADEGLGLAMALKKKFPDKKLIIYSAENQGDRFHRSLRIADGVLSKNADPYEFQEIVEQFYKALHA